MKSILVVNRGYVFYKSDGNVYKPLHGFRRH